MHLGRNCICGRWVPSFAERCTDCGREPGAPESARSTLRTGIPSPRGRMRFNNRTCRWVLIEHLCSFHIFRLGSNGPPLLGVKAHDPETAELQAAVDLGIPLAHVWAEKIVARSRRSKTALLTET